MAKCEKCGKQVSWWISYCDNCLKSTQKKEKTVKEKQEFKEKSIKELREELNWYETTPFYIGGDGLLSGFLILSLFISLGAGIIIRLIWIANKKTSLRNEIERRENRK